MADLSSDQKDEFKLSFKPSALSMNQPSLLNNNNGSANNNQWMSASTNTSMHFQSQFLNQHSPSRSMLVQPENNMTAKSNLSMFNCSPLNDNSNLLNTSSRRSSLVGDSEILFHESVPIIVKTSMMESNTRHLTLKIEKVVSLPQNQHILSITLTDESDPYFLYTLSVTENDFHHLKSDQTLLVDFAVFPKSLVMLLQQCLACKQEEHPKFVAVLVYSSNSAILCVQETNQFRHLQHISLKLQAANADRLKQYLGQTLMAYKSEANKLNTLWCDTKQQLERAKMDKKQAEEYATQMKQKYEECLCDLKSSHAQQISALKQNHLEQMEETRKELTRNRNDMENEFKLQIKTLNLKYNTLKQDFDELNTRKMTLDNKLASESQKLKDAQQELDERREEFTALRTECKTLDQLKFANEKAINEHLLRISAMEQQIKDKGEIAWNNTNLLKSEREQKKSIEEQLQLYKRNLEKSEKKVKECVKEINKGNSIISHLQNEIRNQRNKNKLKQQKLQSIQQLNDNKSNDMNRLNGQMHKKDEMIEKYKAECTELKNTLRACKDKLQESQKAIESNQRVISYLNKQLNENQMNQNIFSSTSAAAQNQYQSPFNMNRHTGISSIGNIGTAISPILSQSKQQTNPLHNNTNSNVNANKPSASSYFPQ
eukprot:39717_1